MGGSRIGAAWMLAVVVLFMALPRSLFHHCHEGGVPVQAPAEGVLHADAHCPICEAPVPVTIGPAAPCLSATWAALGEAARTPARQHVPAAVDAPRLRGPPARA